MAANSHHPPPSASIYLVFSFTHIFLSSTSISPSLLNLAKYLRFSRWPVVASIFFNHLLPSISSCFLFWSISAIPLRGLWWPYVALNLFSSSFSFVVLVNVCDSSKGFVAVPFFFDRLFPSCRLAALYPRIVVLVVLSFITIDGGVYYGRCVN